MIDLLTLATFNCDPENNWSPEIEIITLSLYTQILFQKNERKKRKMKNLI